MTIDLIYATWPNRSYGIGWHKMAGALRDAGLTQQLIDDGHDREGARGRGRRRRCGRIEGCV